MASVSAWPPGMAGRCWPAADEMIAEELVEEKTPEAPDENPVSESVVEESGTDSEDPWAKLDEEIEEIQKPEGQE